MALSLGPIRYARSADLDKSCNIRVHKWMQAIQSPTQYRVGSSVHVKPTIMMKVGIVFLLVIFFFTFVRPSDYTATTNMRDMLYPAYNSTYPLTKPQSVPGGTKYRIAVVADLDTDSKSRTEKNIWMSYLKEGWLTITNDFDHVTIEWDQDNITLKSTFAQGGRGMELSELIAFNGKLYAVDDRTGIIFEISRNHQLLPWVILADGDGNTIKGFKSEWATVKDKALWVGGLGKEWTTVSGEVQNLNPQWVKSVGFHSDVLHHDWHKNYDAMRDAGGFSHPGYMIHESGVWSDIHRKWFFLPRRASTQHYEEVADEKRATNLIFSADESFSDVNMHHIGPFNPVRGFSSFKFIPNTQDRVIIALKSEEDAGKIATYITALTLDGDVLLKENVIGDCKYEGIEFV